MATPSFTSLSPTTNSTVNNANVGYTLNTTITSGTVTYERTGGTAYSNSNHTVNLAGTELNSGSFGPAALTNAPTLVAGAIYTIKFDGTNGTGSATQQTVTGITFQQTVTSFSMSDTALKSGDTSTVTIVFPSAVVQFNSSNDITVINGTLTTMTSSDNITWTGTFTPTSGVDTGGATMTLELSSAYTGATTSDAYTIDTVLPTVTRFTMADTELIVGETSTVTLEFSEAVTEFNSTDDITASNGTLTQPDGTPGTIMTSSDNITWSGLFTPTANITDTTNVLTLGTNYMDTAGNAGPAATTANYTIDTLAPTMTITSGTVSTGATTNDASIALTFTSNEATTNFAVGHISVTNGSLSNFAGSGTAYTATFTPTADGACTIKVNANQYTDASGNNNGASNIFAWTQDDTLPTSVEADNIGPLTIGNNTTSIQINVPIYNDSSLSGGSIQLQMETDNNGTFTDIGTSIAITSSMINTTTTQSIDLTVTTFADGNLLTFRPVITDASGNATTGTEDSTEVFTVDYTPVINVTHNELIAVQPTNYDQIHTDLPGTQSDYTVSVVSASNYNTFTITYLSPNASTPTNMPTNSDITLSYIPGLHILTYRAEGLGGNIIEKRRYILMGYISASERNNVRDLSKESGDVNKDGNVNVTDILVLINKVLHS